jgi:hypothetical protein
MEEILALILFVLIHLFVVASIIGMIIFIVRVILDGHYAMERLLRVAAAAAGLLIYLGARAYGISVPELMYSSLKITEPLMKGLVGVVAPLASGTFVAWFCLRMMQSHGDIAARGLLLFSSLVFAMFADTYAALAAQATPESLNLALPNITFVLGVILFLIFRYKR